MRPALRVNLPFKRFSALAPKQKKKIDSSFFFSTGPHQSVQFLSLNHMVCFLISLQIDFRCDFFPHDYCFAELLVDFNCSYLQALNIDDLCHLQLSFVALTFVSVYTYESQDIFSALQDEGGLLGRFIKQMKSVQKEPENLIFRSQFIGENTEFY